MTWRLMQHWHKEQVMPREKELSLSDGLEKNNEPGCCALAPQTENLLSLESLSEIRQNDTGTVVYMNLSWSFHQCNFPFRVQVHSEFPAKQI